MIVIGSFIYAVIGWQGGEACFTFLISTGDLCFTANWKENEKPPIRFTDVNADDWFYDSVYWAVETDITTGTTDTTFSPSDACTRAQGVTFLYRFFHT